VPFPDLLEGNPAPTICASMHIALEWHHISTMQIIFYNPWPFHMQSFWDSWTPFSWCTVASFSECVAQWLSPLQICQELHGAFFFLSLNLFFHLAMLFRTECYIVLF
jgi:hypothetical protein